MSMTIVLGVIFLQVLVYCIGIYVLFGEKIRNVVSGTFILILCSGIYNLLNLANSDMLYIHVSAIIILWVILVSPFRKKFWIIIKAVYIISCSEETIESILNLCLPQSKNQSASPEKEFILANLILLIIWLMIGEIKKRKIKIKRKYMNSLILIAMGIMAIALVLVIASIQYAEPYVNSKKFSMVSDILMITSYLGIVILGLFVIHVKNANENYKNLLETESLLRNLQKNNYEVMLAKEEETRKFRHDISNHIMCLKEMINDRNIVEANSYIDHMQIVIQQIQKKKYSTGNEIIDVLLNYYIQLLKEDIDVSVSGLCNYDLSINNVELCSIVSNLLQNAIEALNNQKHSKGFLIIQMNSTQQNFKIDICNSFITEGITMIDGLPRTIKRDKENHGFGLKNVKELVNKNDGLFKVEIKQNEFQVTLILPVNNLNLPVN